MATEEQTATTGASGGDEFDALEGKALDDAVKAAKVPKYSQLTADEKRDALRVHAREQQERAADTGEPTPPPPAPPRADGADPEPEGAAVLADSEEYPKALLLSRAERLLGVAPALARALLRDEPENITVAAARERIQGYLDGTVTTPNQEA